MSEFGLEPLFRAHKSEINQISDALVCAVHWCLLSNDFRSIGVGEIAPTESVESSELLPAGWNDQGDVGVYSILYKNNKTNKVFLCKCVVIDDALSINVSRMDGSEKVGSCSVFTDEFCSGDLSSYKQAYRNVTTLRSLVENQILTTIDAIPQASGTSQPESERRSRTQEPLRDRRPDEDDPLRIPTRQPPQPGWPYGHDPFSVGRADMDPFSGGMGGGMFMDPMRPGFGNFGPRPPSMPGQGGLPPGAIPPGARYDPFYPEAGGGRGRGGPLGPRAGPDPDHVRPPDHDFDDMFG